MLRIPLLHVLQNALEISWKLSETIDRRIEFNLNPMDSRLLVVVINSLVFLYQLIKCRFVNLFRLCD